jgi:hypothetical protein
MFVRMRREHVASLRRWAARFTLVIAALASIATSPLRWHVAAPVVSVTGTPGHGRVVVVEASVEPRVMIKSALGIERAASRHAAAGTAWSGSDEYFVPPGWSLTSADIQGTCGGGLCSSKCVPPPGAFVRIARVDVADTWTVEDTFVAPVTFAPGAAVSQLVVQVDSSGGVDVSAEPAPGTSPLAGMGTPVVYETTSSASVMRTFTVNLYASSVATPTTIDFAVSATMHGICRGSASSDAGVEAGAHAALDGGAPASPPTSACAPPTGTRVKVVDAKPL